MSTSPDETLGNQSHATEGAGNDEVGYRNPPKHSRFRPGQSGNPLGRPKGTLSFAPELIDELLRTIADNTTNKRAIVQKLVAAAKEEPQLAMSLIMLCAKLSRNRAADPRAEDDDAFVAKLAEREAEAAKETGDTTPSQKCEETKE